MATTESMFVNGKWVASSDGKTFETRNPATGEVLATLPAATTADVDAAVKAARAAFENPAWRAMDPSERGRLLMKAAALIRARLDEIALVESLDNGKTLREAKGDITFAAQTLEYYAGLADKVQGATIPVPGPRMAHTIVEPVGVTAHIVPWNFPFQLAVRGIAPALAAGNTVVAKPASLTSLSLLKLAKAFEDAGLPAGVFNVVTGSGRVVGNHLASHPGVNSVTLTGSCATGIEVLQAAAKNVVPVTLELGGKSPNIVFPDADIDKAVKGAFYGIFLNAGQMCWAGSRLFVHESIHDEFVQKLVKMAEGWKLGAGQDKDTRMGPLVSKEQQDRVLEYVNIGLKEGATLAFGGKKPEDPALQKGFFVQPTIFTNVRNDMRIAKEEIFGPVLAVLKFSTDEEALRLANESEFGLYAGVWTKNLQRAHKFALGLDAGAVAINEYPITFPQVPFTGFKQSGIGSEQGMTAMDFYTRRKAVITNLG
ncbi:MAG TPA: aldehyde dehydrogenase family protein [Candidatus Thermoplasmatota archaeon]|nr:aldehyde dehydrogenase family protein [Candidatus Thermoplasmatota archaeon]